jgi:class 3 adenylate cyclase
MNFVDSVGNANFAATWIFGISAQRMNLVASHYIPPALLQWSSKQAHPEEIPFAERVDGAVLNVDISGFTDLTERVATLGKPGAEQINHVLTEFFAEVTQVIERHGGIILDYEGDSVIVGWRTPASAAAERSWRDCLCCASDILQGFSSRQFQGHRLDVRVTMGTGAIDLIHLGFGEGRRFLLVAGDAIDEAVSLSQFARAGEALVSADKATRLQDHFSFEPTHTPNARLLGAPKTQAGFSEAPAAFDHGHSPAAETAQRYILPLLRDRLQSALADWMGELRTLTCIFAEIGLSEGGDDLERINAFAIEMERVLESLGGALISIRLRDGHLRAETAFGLPGQSQNNDDWRAIATATALQSWAHSERVGMSAGVATGRAFCGPYGAPQFRQYAVIGSAVNRAARLREVATGRILVDEDTRKICARSSEFDGPWPLKLSGIRGMVQAYVPSRQNPRQPVRHLHRVIGRDRERDLLKSLRTASRTSMQVGVVHGRAGIGKSTLVEAALSDDPAEEGVVAIGMADALDRQTPYLAWRDILRRFLNLPAGPINDVTALPALQARLRSAIGDAPLAPLINDVMDLRLPETRFTAGMPANVRAENLRKLLLKLILHNLRQRHTTLVIEDAQWLDSNSWDLLSEVARAAPSGLVLITSRPSEETEQRLPDLAGSEHTLLHIRLQPLKEAEVIEFANDLLEGSNLSKSLQDVIVQTSDGIPLFVEELCHHALNVDQPVGRGPPELPKVLEAAILGRIDALTPEDQLVLKTASVFGLRFTRLSIARVGRLAERGIDVDAALMRITDMRLFKSAENRPDEFEFRHQIIRDLVYDGMLRDQKVDTHAALARDMETTGTAEDVETLPLLLMHWRGAGDPAKVATYLERLAALRLRQFDNMAAISLLEEYFERIADPTVPRDVMRDARCCVMLGEANAGLGKMIEAETAFCAGLDHLGMRAPTSRLSLSLALSTEILGQILHRVRLKPVETYPLVTEASSDLRHQKAEMAARAHEALMQKFYFDGQKARLLHSALAAANLSEGLGRATPSLAVNTAGLGAICGIIPLRRQARHYLGRASEMAKRVDVPSASSRVSLYDGLYATAAADFETAGRRFREGMASAEAIGNERLWCEHAVSYELICSPWSRTPAFQDMETWRSLLDRLERISRERDDRQVQACALLGRLRGDRSAGVRQEKGSEHETLAHYLAPSSPRLEMIHYAEGAGLLATAALEAGDLAGAMAWLGIARQHMTNIESGMKSRSLPAFAAVFDACRLQMELGDAKDRAAAIELGALVVRKLRTFARIYPIGRPHLRLFQGDLAFNRERHTLAARHWRSGLAQAKGIEMMAAADILSGRLDAFRAGQSPLFAINGAGPRLQTGAGPREQAQSRCPGNSRADSG